MFWLMAFWASDFVFLSGLNTNISGWNVAEVFSGWLQYSQVILEFISGDSGRVF